MFFCLIEVLEKRDDKFSGDGIDSKPPYSYAQLIIQVYKCCLLVAPIFSASLNNTELGFQTAKVVSS